MEPEPKKEENYMTSDQLKEYVMTMLNCDEIHFTLLERELGVVCAPRTIEHAITLWSYSIARAINDIDIKILKNDKSVVDSYIVSNNQKSAKYCIVFDYLDKNEVFTKLSEEHQCWLMLNGLM